MLTLLRHNVNIYNVNKMQIYAVLNSILQIEKFYIMKCKSLS